MYIYMNPNNPNGSLRIKEFLPNSVNCLGKEDVKRLTLFAVTTGKAGMGRGVRSLEFSLTQKNSY